MSPIVTNIPLIIPEITEKTTRTNDNKWGKWGQENGVRKMGSGKWGQENAGKWGQAQLFNFFARQKHYFMLE